MASAMEKQLFNLKVNSRATCAAYPTPYWHETLLTRKCEHKSWRI